VTPGANAKPTAAAEDVDEQHDEHDRLDRREHEQVGLAPEVTEVSHRHDGTVSDAGCRAFQRRCAPARPRNALAPFRLGAAAVI